ncbi:MAG: hypothetical protein MJ203_04765 [archaeon]|nr:hypothetical protein [archaeon]
MPILGVAAIAGTTLPLAVSCDLFDDNTVKIETINLRLEKNTITLGEETFTTRVEFLGTDLVMTGVAIYINGATFKDFTYETLTDDPDYDGQVKITNLSKIHSNSRVEFVPLYRHAIVTEPVSKVFEGNDNIETAESIEDFENTAELDGFKVEEVEIGGFPFVSVINTDSGKPLGNISTELVETSHNASSIEFGIKLTFSNQTINAGTYHLLLNLYDSTGTDILKSDEYTVTYKPKLLAYTPNGYE